MNRTLFVLLLQLFAGQLGADDVLLVDSRGKETTRSGKVLDYRGDRLTLQSSTGREIVIPAARVKRVQADWLPGHREADVRYERFDYESALNLYAAAFNMESRRWVKRKLLARVIRCQRNTERIEEACKNFARLVSDDQQTHYFDTIPLAWKARQPSQDLESLSRSWLGSENEPVKRLMAASWLLSSRDRSSLITVLNDLAKHPSDRISGLAMAQMWRTQIVTIKESELDHWSRQIQAMSNRLRGGPYYLLGKASARFNRPDDAVLAFLRLPSMYAEDHSLARSALFESAKLMQESGHTAEAIRLYRETIKLDGKAVESSQARQQLSRLVND